MPDGGLSVVPCAGGGVDPDFAPLLADERTALREPGKGVRVADLRKAANRFMARAQGPSVAEVVSLQAPGRSGSIRLRAYRPQIDEPAPTIVFLHGGGFVMGDLDSHDAMCRTLAAVSGATLIAVDYRLAPEHPFPAALDDAEDAIAWIRGNAGELGFDGQRLAIVGDSAGGQLAVAATLRERAASRPVRHVALLYPLLDPSRSSASQREFGEGYMLTASFIAWGWRSYNGSSASLSGDALFDVRGADWRGFPATTMVTAGCDPLRDEGEDLWRALREAGIDAVLRRYEGMIHGFAGLPQITGAATDALSFVGVRLAKAMKVDTTAHVSAG